MITINKAALHIFDFNSDIAVYSDEELDLQNQVEISFITKHIEKSLNDSGLHSGKFLPESNFFKELSSYMNNTMSFLDFSTEIAKLYYSVISKSDKLVSTDLIFCDFICDDVKYLAILECNNKMGYTHQVLSDGGKVKTQIISHYAILPGATQKVDGCAFINLSTGAVKFDEKKRTINGEEVAVLPDKILQCSSSISQKDTVKIVKKIADKVAEEHGQNPIVAVSKAKKFIAENAEVSDDLETEKLGKEVFSKSEVMQKEFVDEVKQAGISDTVKMDKTFAVKTARSHKIKTDTGIIITVPADYFENKDYIEFINNTDGTISIELKNIGRITNG